MDLQRAHDGDVTFLFEDTPQVVPGQLTTLDRDAFTRCTGQIWTAYQLDRIDDLLAAGYIFRFGKDLPVKYRNNRPATQTTRLVTLGGSAAVPAAIWGVAAITGSAQHPSGVLFVLLVVAGVLLTLVGAAGLVTLLGSIFTGTLWRVPAWLSLCTKSHCLADDEDAAYLQQAQEAVAAIEANMTLTNSVLDTSRVREAAAETLAVLARRVLLTRTDDGSSSWAAETHPDDDETLVRLRESSKRRVNGLKALQDECTRTNQKLEGRRRDQLLELEVGTASDNYALEELSDLTHNLRAVT